LDNVTDDAVRGGSGDYADFASGRTGKHAHARTNLKLVDLGKGAHWFALIIIVLVISART
jgi:hypothetical protein